MILGGHGSNILSRLMIFLSTKIWRKSTMENDKGGERLFHEEQSVTLVNNGFTLSITSKLYVTKTNHQPSHIQSFGIFLSPCSQGGKKGMTI